MQAQRETANDMSLRDNHVPRPPNMEATGKCGVRHLGSGATPTTACSSQTPLFPASYQTQPSQRWQRHISPPPIRPSHSGSGWASVFFSHLPYLLVYLLAGFLLLHQVFGGPGTETGNMDTTNQQAARAAKRFLTERVRNDWSWPDTPEPWLASDEEVLEVTEFRERYYGDSCSEDNNTAGPSSSTSRKAASTTQPPQAEECKFDSPDSVADEVAQKRQERKRKRRAAQEEEMQWNAGLSMFVERRDVWTGAAAVRKYGTQRGKSGDNTALTHSSSKNDPTDPLIPVAPTLLADNAIRASIRPSTYPDIYNNVVVMGRSPTVPVNLADMTRALVVGWKNDGEWPPKPGPLDPLAGKRRVVTAAMKQAGEGPFLSHHPHVKKGVDSVKRILHLNGHQNENGVQD